MTDTEGGLAGPALYIGILVVLAWLGLILWLVIEIEAQEVQWARLAFLLGSIEAVAFGAAGALFGTQIQRQRVADARQRAEKAELEATENKDAATKGKALAAAVKAEAKAAEKAPGIERMSAAEPAGGGMSISLALANELLP